MAGQLQSQRGRIDGARERMARVAGELEELERKLGADREQTREARGRLEAAVAQMSEHELRRQRSTASAARCSKRARKRA